jgi:hypothetical protein
MHSAAPYQSIGSDMTRSVCGRAAGLRNSHGVLIILAVCVRRANSGHSSTAPTGSSASVALGFNVRTGGRTSAVS